MSARSDGVGRRRDAGVANGQREPDALVNDDRLINQPAPTAGSVR